ncbi:MAG: FG-GAP-like repeat-containing protein [Chloroflexota bacterium]|nr:FG-GAP-like repeat-containing protein [Chloroflexota bacterium]
MKPNRNSSTEKRAIFRHQRVRTMIATVAGIALLGSLGTVGLAYGAQAPGDSPSKHEPASPNACATPSFSEATHYDSDATNGAYSMAVGDLNRDNWLDLVVGTGTGSAVKWLPGNGTGGFGPATDIVLGNSPWEVVIADFNKDGMLDVASVVTMGKADKDVAVALGDGMGGFGSPINSHAGENATSLAVADFNKDTKPDLVVDEFGGVHVLLGNGNGTFAAPAFYGGANPYHVTTGDVNNDGNPDVVAANGDGDDVSVLLGNGDGTLDKGTIFDAGENPLYVAVGDLNGDGNADLVVPNSGSSNVSVFLGDGDGNFSGATDYPTGSEDDEGPRSAVIADFNSDGKRDVAVANTASHTVAVLLGDGAGGLGAPTKFPVAEGPRWIVAADFNRNGSLDLATVSRIDGTVSVLLNTCPAPNPPACNIQFSDVPPGSTYYPYVTCLACRNVLGGYPDGTFKPGNDVTRGQLSKIVANAGGYNEPVSGQSFPDVPPGSTFYEFVERMAKRGIIGGFPDGTFKPGNNATRGQISKIVSNAKGYNEEVSGQTFPDVPPGSTYYEFIERMVSRGIIGGFPDGTFKPGNNATRGQVSKIVANAFFPDCQAAQDPQASAGK